MLVVNTTSALSWATSSKIRSASTSGETFSRLVMGAVPNSAFRASMPFSWPHPRARLGIVLVQEHHFQLAGLLGKDVQLANWLAARFRLQRELDGVGRLRQDDDLIHSREKVFHLRRVDWHASRIPVDRQIPPAARRRGQVQGRNRPARRTAG